MVADRHRLAAIHSKHCWRAFRRYQHRWPWTTLNAQNRGFSEFFAILGYGVHWTSEFSLKLLEIDKTTCVRNNIILMLWRVSWALAQISCRCDWIFSDQLVANNYLFIIRLIHVLMSFTVTVKNRTRNYVAVLYKASCYISQISGVSHVFNRSGVRFKLMPVCAALMLYVKTRRVDQGPLRRGSVPSRSFVAV